MRARGVVALSMLGVAIACGGRTSFLPDEPAGSGGSGGKTQGHSGAASGGTSATRGGASVGGSGQIPSAGSTSSGGGPCLCVNIGCSNGFVRAPDPNNCCGGECVLDCRNMGCSDIDLVCRPGMHVGKLPDECCPLCVPDAAPSCDVAMKLYEEFRTERLNKYQAAGCQDSGCALFSELNRCASTCGAPIPSAFRDLIEEDLNLFAEQTCSACPKPYPNPCPAAPPFSCVDNRCQTQPVGPQ